MTLHEQEKISKIRENGSKCQRLILGGSPRPPPSSLFPSGLSPLSLLLLFISGAAPPLLARIIISDILLLLLGLFPPAVESSSSASASSGLRRCFCCFSCFSFFFSHDVLLALVLDSGEEGELFIIDGPNGSLAFVGEGGLIREKFLGGDFLVNSSEGLRVLRGGENLFGNMFFSLSIEGGGVLDCAGTEAIDNGDLERSAAGVENIGVEARDGGSGVISGGDGSGGGILSSIPALVCVDSGEGIRSMELECSLGGAVSWCAKPATCGAFEDVVEGGVLDLGVEFFPIYNFSHSLVVEREIIIGSVPLATDAASSSSMEENCSEKRGPAL